MTKERTIIKALKALVTSKCPSIAAATRKYGISYNTLYDRYKRKATTRQYAQQPQIALSKAQEEAVVKWIGALTTKGFPPIYSLLRARIEAIRKLENPKASPLGKNYLTRFINRHPELGAAISNR